MLPTLTLVDTLVWFIKLLGVGTVFGAVIALGVYVILRSTGQIKDDPEKPMGHAGKGLKSKRSGQ